MKIAVITDDGSKISQHFGRARNFFVLDLEDGKIISREMREKLGHHQFSGGEHTENHHEEGHGAGPHSHHKHTSVVEVISDCKVLICCGMGMGAYESLLSLNIQPVITDMQDIESAIQAYIAGNLPNLTERLH